METIQRLNEEQGHTIILITHELHTAEHAERILTILDGRIDSNKKVAQRRRTTDVFEK